MSVDNLIEEINKAYTKENQVAYPDGCITCREPATHDMLVIDGKPIHRCCKGLL